MRLELLRDAVLVDNADAGELEAVQDGRVDLDGDPISPQVGVAAFVKAQSIGNDLYC